MANIKSRPGLTGDVRKTHAVGPDYPESHYRNPWNAGIDEPFNTIADGDNNEFQENRYFLPEDRTLNSPTSTAAGMNSVKLNEVTNYDSNWEHGTRSVAKTPKGHKTPTRWTPKGGGRS